LTLLNILNLKENYFSDCTTYTDKIEALILQKIYPTQIMGKIIKELYVLYMEQEMNRHRAINCPHNDQCLEQDKSLYIFDRYKYYKKFNCLDV